MTISTRPRTISELRERDRKSTRLNSSHVSISYADFCLKKINSQKAEKSCGYQRDASDAAPKRQTHLLLRLWFQQLLGKHSHISDLELHAFVTYLHHTHA